MTAAVKRIKQALRLTLDHPKSLSCDHGMVVYKTLKEIKTSRSTWDLRPLDFLFQNNILYLKKKVNLIDLI